MVHLHHGLMQPRIGAAAVHEIFMRANFTDDAVIDDDESVGLAQGAQTMSDGDGGAAFDEMIECGLDLTLRFGVH